MPISDFLETTWHFSSKMTNSNAALCTVKVGTDKQLDMPYVSARTTVKESSLSVSAPNRQVASDNFLLDMLNGIDPKLRQEAKAAAAEKDRKKREANGEIIVEKPKKESTKVDYYADLSDADRDEIAADSQITHINWNGEISARAKQILLPMNGGYNGCIPLMAYGLMHSAISANEKAYTELKDSEDAKENHRYIRPLNTIPYTIGGSKPQNVGFNLDSKYLKLIVTGFKRRHNAMSLRASVLHGKMQYKLKTDYATLDKYVDFIARGQWSKHEIPAHTAYVEHIIGAYFKQAEDFKYSMETEDMQDITDSLTLGFLDITYRDSSWKTLCVHFFMQKVKATFMRKYGDSDVKFHERFVRNIAESVISQNIQGKAQ